MNNAEYVIRSIISLKRVKTQKKFFQIKIDFKKTRIVELLTKGY
jgi:hypothetical protein